MDLEQMKKIAGIADLSVTPSKPKTAITEEMQFMAKVAGIVLTEACSMENEEEDKKDDKESKNPFAKKESDDKESDDDEECDEDSDDEECDDEDDELKESIDDDEGPRTKQSTAKPASEEAKKKAEARKGTFWLTGGAKKEEKKEEKKPAPKKEKSESESSEPKKRGKAQNPESKTGRLRAWIKDHPGVKRAEAWKHAVDTIGEKSEDNPGGITKAGFSTLYQNARAQSGLAKKREVKECWVISHPSINTHVLHENREMNQYQWIHFLSDDQEPLVFETEEEATKVAHYIRDFKNQYFVIEHVVLED